MEWTLIILVIGAAFVVLALVAIRGSFRSDDAFYGESTTVPDESPAVPDARASANVNQGDEPSDADGGADGGIHDHGPGGG